MASCLLWSVKKMCLWRIILFSVWLMCYFCTSHHVSFLVCTFNRDSSSWLILLPDHRLISECFLFWLTLSCVHLSVSCAGQCLLYCSWCVAVADSQSGILDNTVHCPIYTKLPFLIIVTLHMPICGMHEFL